MKENRTTIRKEARQTGNTGNTKSTGIISK